MRLFAELKRRNVLRAGAFYAASAWLLVQVATQVFPFVHIAEWMERWIVVAAAIGFPFALLFSWFYEWTPQGLQRESAIPPKRGSAARDPTRRRADAGGEGFSERSRHDPVFGSCRRVGRRKGTLPCNTWQKRQPYLVFSVTAN
jgi:hypothetical protein